MWDETVVYSGLSGKILHRPQSVVKKMVEKTGEVPGSDLHQ